MKLSIRLLLRFSLNLLCALSLGIVSSWLMISLVITRFSDITPGLFNRWSLVITLGCAILFYFLIKWVKSLWQFTRQQFFFLVLFCFAAGVFLTDVIPEKVFEGRYIPLFQPKNSFRVEVPHTTGSLPESVTLNWVNGLYGDISFQTFSMNNWQITDDGIVVQSEVNWLEWSGVTGPRLTLVFKPVVPGSEIRIFWNRATEPQVWQVNGMDQLIIHKDFDLPFLATANFVKSLLMLWLSALGLLVIPLLRYGLSVSKGRNKSVSEGQNPGFYSQLITILDGDNETEFAQAGLKLTRTDWLIVAAFILAAIVIRVINLDTLALTYDEYFHLQAAKELLNGVSLSEVYSRSLYLVTLPIAFSGLFSGVDIFSSRLPGVIASALAFVPLYLITKKYGRSAAILACFLYLTHPLMTALSRMAREYAYQPLIFFLVVLAMLSILRHLPQDMLIRRDVGKLLNKNTALQIIFLILVAVYSLLIDQFSTIRLIMPAYVLFAIFLASRFKIRNIPNLVAFGFAFVVVLWIVFHYWNLVKSFQIDANLAYYQLSGFTSSSVENWYFKMPVFIPLLAIAISVWAAFLYRKKSDSLLFIVGLALMYLLIFNSVFTEAYRNRYTFSIYFWIIILLAFGLSTIWRLIRLNVKSKFWNVVIMGGLLFSFINFQQVIKPITITGEFLDITNLSYYKMENVEAYVRQHQIPSDGLVSTVYYKYVQLNDTSRFAGLEYYSWESKDPTQAILEQMAEYETGWVVLDYARGVQLSQPLPMNHTVLNGIDIEYIGQIDSQFVWHWQRME